jgi:hypothetical protein
MTMKLNTPYPAVRFGFGRFRIGRDVPVSRPGPRGAPRASTLSREEVRRAVIEVLG